MNTQVVVRFQCPGLHRWPFAPERRRYLAHLHRHLFHVEVRLEVLHQDREIEFHDLLDFCLMHFPGGDQGSKSCEMMAEGMVNDVIARWPGRRVQVAVFEDGEVGAEVTYVPDQQAL